MQEQYSLFREHQEDIEVFIKESISNIGSLALREKDNFQRLFKMFPSLELIYVGDTATPDIIQISDNIYRKRISNKAKGRPRGYLLKKVKLVDDFISISQPYISGATGKTCITVAIREDDRIYFLDLNLTTLLKRLSLLEVHETFDLSVKIFYILSASSMMILALFTIGYSMYEFGTYLFQKHTLSIENIFKPVIVLTLGLAII